MGGKHRRYRYRGADLMLGLSLGLSAPLAGLFTPGALSPLYWFDASDALTLYQDTGLTTLATAGQPLQGLKDKSGNGRNLVQGTVGKIPVVGSIGANTAVDLDGTTFMQSGAFAVSQPFALAIVYKLDSTSGTRTPISSTTSTRASIYSSDGFYKLYAGSSAYSAFVPDTSVHSMIAWFSGANSVIWMDGTRFAMASSPGTNGFNGVTMGSGYTGASELIDGQIGEALAWASASEPNILKVQAYLKAKWGTP